MKNEKCTSPSLAQTPVRDRHEIRITDPVLAGCSLGELGQFVARHESLDQLPCAFASETGLKVRVETTAGRGATFVFLPEERASVVGRFQMRELNEETAME